MGLVDIAPDPAALVRDGAYIEVLRYDDTQGGGSAYKYELLPNIRVLSITKRKDAYPSVARFRYSFQERIQEPDWPRRIEEVWTKTSSSPYVVVPDDRLVVRLITGPDPDVDFAYLFDGFVQLPQFDMSAKTTEAVTFEAFGTPVRLFDLPIVQRRQRSSEDPFAGKAAYVQWPPIRFNPGGEPNATPAGADVNWGMENQYPLFLDERLKRVPEVRRVWTIAMAVRYLLYVYNKDEEYVENTASLPLETLLSSWEPTGDVGGINSNDPTTYTTVEIPVQDLDISGDTLPVAIAKVINPHGFAFRFHLESDANGDPLWSFQFYREDAPEPVKSLRIQPAGVAHDPSAANTSAIALQRDGEVVNEYFGMTKPILYQIGGVLSPAFSFTSTDGDDGNLTKWVEGNPAFDSTKFRDYVLDEAGDGHWNFTGSTFDTAKATSLDSVLGVAVQNQNPPYLARRRPARDDLLTKNSVTKEELKPQLWIGNAGVYDGPVPGVFDPSKGAWRQVTGGGWKVLDDRFGIRLTCTDPNDWNVGRPTVWAPPAGTACPAPDGRLRTVKMLTQPSNDPGYERVYFLLIAVIEGDQGLGQIASRRDASPIGFTISRADELRDRFEYSVIDKSSNIGGLFPASTVKDERPQLKAHLEARRRSTELAVINGPAHIPYITLAYEVGDRIDNIEGREISLTQNVIFTIDEQPVYPSVVGITWEFGDQQGTRLELSDVRPEPPPERRK